MLVRRVVAELGVVLGTGGKRRQWLEQLGERQKRQNGTYPLRSTLRWLISACKPLQRRFFIDCGKDAANLRGRGLGEKKASGLETVEQSEAGIRRGCLGVLWWRSNRKRCNCDGMPYFGSFLYS